MNGRPIARVALIAFFLAVLAWPVWNLTREQPAPSPAPKLATKENTVEIDLALMSSSPATVEVRYAGLTTSESKTAVMVKSKMRVPVGEKIDLLVKGQWAVAATPQALRVVVSWDGEDLTDKTFWGTEGVEDVVNFTAPNP